MRIIRIALLTLALLFFGFIGLVLYASSTTQQMWHVCGETKVFRKENIRHLETIYTRIFDRAKNCDHNAACEERVSRDILDFFVESEKVTQFPTTYFIRESDDGVIEKLFLSGRYETKRASTKEELKVLAVLQGKRKEICTEGWRLENGIGTDMTYLRDLYSEAEAIIPVDINGERVGAIVKGIGD